MTENQEVAIVEGTTKPFGGIVPDTVMGRVLAEIVADPFSQYTPKSLAELTMKNPSRVSEALREYERLGLIKRVDTIRRQPIYEANADSKKLHALTFLALAVNDDVLDEKCMDQAVIDYVQRCLGYTLFSNLESGVCVKGTGPNGEPYAVVATTAFGASFPTMGMSV